MATATVKHPSLVGHKLLVVQPQTSDGAVDGDPQLAVDMIGAGWGETVMITSDGRGAREYLGTDTTPARWTIIALKDELHGGTVLT
jgi:ethanolamine utilization protein EutN